MAVKHPINRIQVAVSPSTTSKYRGSPYIDTESKASDHIGSRNQVITTKTGHRSGTWPRPVKRFFLQVLPDSKKGWGNPTYFRLEGPQCLSKASNFSHATSSRCYTGSEQKQLVRYYRPEGWLLPHSNCGTSQEVPSFSCQWSDIPIQSSSFRLSPGTQNFYQMCASCTRTFTAPRHAYPPLPQLLATVRSLSTPSTTADKVIDTAYTSARTKNKLQENLSNSCSDGSVHWHEARLVHHASHFDRSQISGNCKDGCKISNRQAPSICRLSPSSWNVGGSNTSGAAGNAATPTSSTQAEFTTPISHDPKTCFGNGDSSMFSHSETLVLQRSSSQGCSLGSPSCKERSCNNRCISTRLGSCVETSESEGSMAQHVTAHPRSRDEGSMASAATFSTSVKGQTCPNKNRQYHSGVLYQPPRGNKISEPVKFGTKALEMGGCPSPLSESQVSSRSLQSNSGLSVSGQSHTLGLADSQGSDSGNLGHLWQGRGGLICGQADNSLSDVVFRQGRARGSGPGYVGTQLAKIPLVCFPPLPLLWMTLRRIQETMQPVLLVAPFWPNRPWFYLLLLLLTPANKTRFVISGERDVVASKAPHSEVMGVAPRGNPVILECSQGVEHTLLNARAPSTWRAYTGKWKAFSQWFEEKEIVPHDCPLRDLLDFLQSLLEHVFSCSTIKVYVAALSAYRGPVEGMTLVIHNLIRSFLKSVSRLRPSRKVMVPQWDLNLALSSLSCAPFEPLMNAAIKWLSLKSAFLLAIATARCVSELHALSVSPQCLRWGPECKQATLWPNSVFLPKLLSPQYINKPIIISVLQTTADQSCVQSGLFSNMWK